MNGSPRAPLPRPGRLPRPRLTLQEAAAAAAAAEVEGVGLGAQARSGSYPRRGTRMEKAGNRVQPGRRSRSLCNNFIGNQLGRTLTATGGWAGGQGLVKERGKRLTASPGREKEGLRFFRLTPETVGLLSVALKERGPPSWPFFSVK